MQINVTCYKVYKLCYLLILDKFLSLFKLHNFRFDKWDQ
jgi:hypothetical protein